MENEKTMMKIILSDEIKAVCPDFVCGCVEAQVENTPYSEALWGEIEEREARFKRRSPPRRSRTSAALRPPAASTGPAARTFALPPVG